MLTIDPWKAKNGGQLTPDSMTDMEFVEMLHDRIAVAALGGQMQVFGKWEEFERLFRIRRMSVDSSVAQARNAKTGAMSDYFMHLLDADDAVKRARKLLIDRTLDYLSTGRRW